jgi:cyanophycinase
MNQREAMPPVSGTLALIGGGDYAEAEQVDRFLLELAGGPNTPVAFLPAARSSRRMGEKFTEYYQSLGAVNVRVAPVYEREDADNEENARLLRDAGLIFIGWGSDDRLQRVIRNTPVYAALEEAYRHGVLVAGMSAGARAMGEIVISPANGPVGLREGLDQSPLYAGPDAMDPPRANPDGADAQRSAPDDKGPLRLRPGFNWLPGFGIEAHLAEWNRLGHLLVTAALRPDLTWIGLDERTALVISPDGEAEVVGSGNVIVARRSPSVLAVPPRPGKALEALGLHLDVLSHGSRTTLDELRQPS